MKPLGGSKKRGRRVAPTGVATQGGNGEEKNVKWLEQWGRFRFFQKRKRTGKSNKTPWGVLKKKTGLGKKEVDHGGVGKNPSRKNRSESEKVWTVWGQGLWGTDDKRGGRWKRRGLGVVPAGT